MIPLHDRRSRGTLFAGAAIALVLLAVGAGVYVMGSPSENRARRLDERRVNDLRDWTRAVDSFWTANKQLPSSLAEVKRQQAWSYLAEYDTATGRPYDYNATGTSTYQLCATFDRASNPDGARRDPIWDHAAGRVCVPLEARTPQ
jgi:hypothetical protein